MEEQEEFKKVTLLDQLSIAVSSPKNYRHLVFRKKGRLVLFVVVLSFLLAFIEFGIDTIFWINKVGGFGNLATNEIPAFEYKNGRLAIERDVQLEFSGATLYINTEKAAVDLNDMETDGVYVTIGSEKIVMGMVTGGVGYTYMETPHKTAVACPDVQHSWKCICKESQFGAFIWQCSDYMYVCPDSAYAYNVGKYRCGRDIAIICGMACHVGDCYDVYEQGYFKLREQ